MDVEFCHEIDPAGGKAGGSVRIVPFNKRTVRLINSVATPSAMKFLALAFLLAAAGCGREKKGTGVHNPYDGYLPQTAPSETNRVEFSAGYSIVSPIGWTSRTIPIEDWFKDSVADQITIEGHVADEYPPRISIQHLGPGEYALYKEWLRSTNNIPGGWTHTEFQGQPALSKFLPGYGKRKAKGNWWSATYQPWLTQSLFFERDGNGFILDFDMRNADKDEPYYMHPVPVIEEYFRTFRFRRLDK
jgi:hypothetical protein